MTSRTGQILICDDDQLVHLAIKTALKSKWNLRSAYHSDEALALLSRNQFDVILLDIQMRTDDEGLRLLKKINEAWPELPAIILSGRTDFDTVRETIRLGAFDYIPKDFDPEDLAHTLARALERSELIRRREQQNFEVAGTQGRHALVGESAAIRNVRKMIEKFRASQANVVITGETGSGKEVIARQLRGTLPDGSLAPFVAIDSSTIQSSTAESLLFGHERGAFTGAEQARRGIFEEADGGIVYFDEIANMPLEIQAKLLRVLQEKEVTRMGSTRIIPTEFRVICATNRKLEDLVRAGQFKEDLYQRLAVLPIEAPGLRDRPEDIPVLANHFLSRGKRTAHLRFTEGAIELLKAHSWPGNVRELDNVISYVGAMAEGDEIEITDLPPKLRDQKPKAEKDFPGQSFYDRVAEFEKKILAADYAAAGGNISRLATQLGMDRSHLHSKLKEYGIHSAKASGKEK